MRIAIDGKRYYLNRAGLGRYSRNLVDNLQMVEEGKDLDVSVFKPAGKTTFELPKRPHLHELTAEYKIPGHLGNALWRFTQLPEIIKQGGYDLFHGPSQVLPGV